MAAIAQGALPLDFSEAVAQRGEQIAAALDERPGGPDGWRPTRLLFRHFWLFEREEFRFVHGRLFLRGANASGKSTVLAAAVPLVLDGDRTRHRLDPFGGGGRSLQYFLLGPDTADRDDPQAFYHEQRIGYVALEFRRRAADGGAAQYRTIGIGLHCSRHRSGMPVTFWGFCLRDGRRLGRGFDVLGVDGTPMRRQDLEVVLGDGGTVVTTIDAYRELVNEALFGFADLQDFRHVLQLLLELRAPKLNRDMGPRVVGELLGESLPPVDPELFTQLKAILERMDDYVDGCAELRRRQESAQRLDEAVTLVQLRRSESAAARYLQALEALQRARDEQTRASEAWRRAGDEWEAARERCARVDTEAQRVEGALAAQRDSEVLRAEEALAGAQERLGRATQRVGRAEVAEAEHRSRLEQAERSVRVARALWSSRADALHREMDGFGAAADRAEWPLAADVAARLREGLAPFWTDAAATGDSGVGATVGWLRDAARGRTEQLDRVCRAIEARDRCEAAEQRAAAVFEVVHEATLQARQEQARRESALVEAAQSAAAQVRDWWRALAGLRLEPREVAAACEALEAHRDPGGDAGAALEPLRRAGAAQLRSAQEARAETVRQRDAAAAASEAKAQEVQAAAAETEAVPPRSEASIAARAALAAAGVDARPLYETQELPAGDAAAAGRLEAAVEQAGLLDALVVAAGDLPRARACLEAGGLAEVFVTDPQATRAALAGAEGGGSAAAFRPDGGWRHGLLEGRAAASADSSGPRYFGVENRRRRHQERLRRLKEEWRDLERSLAAAEASVAEAAAAQERLGAELDALHRLPGLAALQRAATRAQDAAARAEEAGRSEEAQLARLEAAREAAAAAWRALQEAQAPVPETRDCDAASVRELIERLRELVQSGRNVEGGARALEDAARALDGAQEAVARERQDLEAAGGDLERERGERAREEAQAGTLRELLDSPQGRQERERFRGLLADQRRLEREGREAAAGRVRLEVQVEHLARAAPRADTQAQEAVAPERDALTALDAQLGAYPTFASQLQALRSGPSGPLDVARVLLQRRRDDQRQSERIAADLDAAKTELLRAEIECRDVLADYAPELDDAAGLLRFRSAGPSVWPCQLRDELQDRLQQQEQLLRKSERELYEEFLLHQMREALHRHIHDTEDWVERINADLREARLGSGETLELRWVPVPGAGIAAHLSLLRSDPAMLRAEERQALADAFRAEVERVRREERDQAGDLGFGEALEEAMDYRRWFRFEIVSRAPHQRAALIDDRRFATRSGAEKSLALMLPLAAAAAARYQLARPDAPRLIAFDEAFAGVDPQNVEEALRFLQRFGFSWVMASERLWGVGSVLPAAATYEILRRGNVVGALPFFWDGTQLIDAGATVAAPAAESGA